MPIEQRTLPARRFGGSAYFFPVLRWLSAAAIVFLIWQAVSTLPARQAMIVDATDIVPAIMAVPIAETASMEGPSLDPAGPILCVTAAFAIVGLVGPIVGRNFERSLRRKGRSNGRPGRSRFGGETGFGWGQS